MAYTSTIESKPTFFKKGRYTYKHEFTKIKDWDSIFDHVLGIPSTVYDTAQYIYNKEFLGHKSRYPDVMYIPLVCSYPNLRRCILYVETTEMIQLFIPVEVTYHSNHPIAKAIEQLFFNSKENRSFITDNEIMYYYTVRNQICVQKMKKLLTEPENFEEFDKAYQLSLSNVLQDPDLVAYAKSKVIYCDPDIDPIGAKESSRQWRAIIYPESSKEERKLAYLQFIFNQINIHRCERIRWQSNNPELSNPFILPCESHKENSLEKQNNHKRHDLANNYIQKLWNYLNDDEKMQVVITDVSIN